MASEWIKCTSSVNGEAVYVNLALAVTISKTKNGSDIWFGHADSYAQVKETPEEIQRMRSGGMSAAPS